MVSSLCGTGTPPASENQIPEDLACVTDSDCRIACRSTFVCCDEACECADVINLARHREIQQWATEHCNAVPCDEWDCDVPAFNHMAVCVEGQCHDETTPWQRPL
ncbi:MAG: hypothetical protein ACJAYU_001410 [Bradymonadia bacterium]|jgi:hypothetical protein